MLVLHRLVGIDQMVLLVLLVGIDQMELLVLLAGTALHLPVYTLAVDLWIFNNKHCHWMMFVI